jgi:hypothetical protein
MENGHLKIDFAFHLSKWVILLRCSFLSGFKTAFSKPIRCLAQQSETYHRSTGKKTTNCDGFVGHLIRAPKKWPADGPK